MQLAAFSKFEDTTQALAAATAICEGTQLLLMSKASAFDGSANVGKLDKGLKKFLKANLSDVSKLAVGDVKLGSLIKDKFGVKCIFDDTVSELLRGIRNQVSVH